MPIYEFRCLNCDDLFEMLVMNPNEPEAVKCPKCDSSESERVMSTTSFCVTGECAGPSGASAQTRNCTGGSCTTYDIPGPK